MTKRRSSRQLEELSHFLRTRRLRLSPEDAGLGPSGRRRTPGLRREEVAVLAGVGTSWYTWLEQGRDINASESVLSSVSRALQLGPDEDTYLRRLAGLKPPRNEGGGYDDRERLAEIVNHWFPNPALVRDRCWNIVAANSAVPEFLGYSGVGSNILVQFFADETCRRRYAHADELAHSTVARFRTEVADCFDRPEVERIVEELTERSPQFAELWNSHEVLSPMKAREKQLTHPDVGTLGFDVHEWELAADREVQLILHMPSTKETAVKLDDFFAVADPDEPGGDGQAPPEKAASRA